MEDRAKGPRELALAALGAVALTTERIETLAEAIAAHGGAMSHEEASAFLREQVERWREEALKVGGHALAWRSALIRELGLATRDEIDELELRVAGLEHRLHLLEDRPNNA